jgi:uncharacterized protein involved in type VI secretion and phage assembly
MSLSAIVPSETALEAGGHVKGVAVAIVREIKDGSGIARVKVSYPWHSQPGQSYWARIVTLMAGSKRGAYFLPEVGDEVLVAFERGDMRFPYVLGSLWNGQDKSPLDNANGKNDVRAIYTRKGHKLTFDDGQRGRVQLELNDGKRLTIDDDGIQLDDGQGNSLKLESQQGAISLTAATKLSISAPQISIEASGALKLSANATLEISGTLVKIN